jgi:hypothetical protein
MKHMKHKVFLIIAALLIPWCPVEVHAAEPIRLRILCYNIHHAEGVDRKLDVERIASGLRA